MSEDMIGVVFKGGPLDGVVMNRIPYCEFKELMTTHLSAYVVTAIDEAERAVATYQGEPVKEPTP